MSYEYFDSVIHNLKVLKMQGLIDFESKVKLDFTKLKRYISFPDDLRYLLEQLGFVEFTKKDSYLLFGLMIEEIASDDFDYLDEWTENSELRLDVNKLFIGRNVDSAFYAYHLDEKPIKIHEYCFSERIYFNVFEILDEQIIKVCEDWK